MAQDTPLAALATSDAGAVVEGLSDLQIQATPDLPPIEQSSIFSVLPSELILEIFSYLDILSIFEFLDTCRYHRYMLLNLPEIWRRVRFIPLSELITLQQNSSTASNVSPDPVASTATGAPSTFVTRQRSDNGTETTTSETTKPSHRLKHAENERDRERGGSRSLISEIYAVLRRFRKDNRLVDFVREIHMDSTDSPQFPSPLVMLIKFPHLEVLSSRYRRGQTSLNTDTHTLKDMLRNGDISDHSLKLRRWDVFHPYMTDEDAVGFKAILDAISVVGQENHGPGVALDIKPCPGPPEGAPVEDTSAAQDVTVHHGLHWATSIPLATTQAAPPSTALPATTNTGSTAGVTTMPSQGCSNIVWKLEKCRICLAPQDRCWKCVKICSACRAVRAPPHINHQTALERERAARLSNGRSAVANRGAPAPVAPGRPVTPPGSISLSQLSNASANIPSAYLSLRGAGMASLTSAMMATSSSAVHIPVALPIPPEFSFFD